MLRSAWVLVLSAGIGFSTAVCNGDSQGPTGTDTFTATIDGVPWQGRPEDGMGCEYDTATLSIRAWGGTLGDTIRFIELRYLTAVGTVTLGGSDCGIEMPERCPSAILSQGPVGVWQTTDELPGSASVTELDFARLRCSGTFSFDAPRRIPMADTDTVHVRNGSWATSLIVR